MAPSQLDRTNAFFTALSGVSSFVVALPDVREIGLYIVPRLPGPFRWLWDRTIGPGPQSQTTPPEEQQPDPVPDPAVELAKQTLEVQKDILKALGELDGKLGQIARQAERNHIQDVQYQDGSIARLKGIDGKLSDLDSMKDSVNHIKIAVEKVAGVYT